MARRVSKAALLRKLRRGDYVVDVSAVADAMVASGVLVAFQPRHPFSALVEQDESPARQDLT